MWKSLWYNYRSFIKWNAATSAIFLHLTTYVSVAKTWRKVRMYFCRSNCLASLFRGPRQKEHSHLTPLPVVYGFYEGMISYFLYVLCLYQPALSLSNRTDTPNRRPVYSGEAQRWRAAWHFLSPCQEKDTFFCQAPHISCLHSCCNWRTHFTPHPPAGAVPYSWVPQLPWKRHLWKKYYPINQGLWLNYIAHLKKKCT